jgi:hypothetical protein
MDSADEIESENIEEGKKRNMNMKRYSIENKNHTNKKSNCKVVKPNIYTEVSEAMKNQSPKNISELILETLR